MSANITRSLLWILSINLLACNFITSIVPVPRSEPIPSATQPGVAAAEPTVATSMPGVPSLPTTSPLPSPSPTALYQPVFEPAACAFPVPSGYTPECGYLVVPEDRSNPQGAQVRLHAAIFRSRAADPAPDPVVHLAGGPGSSSLNVARYMFRQGLGAILDRRDFILFDQRGTGYSSPRLDCPERQALVSSLLAKQQTGVEANRAIVDALRQCRERLAAAGISLAAYNSAASAADVNDLQLAMGYEQLNLYGVSYGTRLALTIMRDFPHAVRSAVLDSAYPLQVHLYTSLASNAERAFNVLFDGCASDPDCNAAYPDLRNVFYALVDGLNANPAPVSLTVNGVEHTAMVDGGLLIDVVFVGLYNPYGIALMPKMIHDTRQGDYTILRDWLALYFDTSSALGVQMSVQCNEEIPFGSPDDAFSAAQEVQPQIAAFFPNSIQPLFAACEAWGLPTPDPRENQPVHSDRPALVLAGEFDPVTPPEWGRLTTEDLSRAHYFEFPENGHWVTRSSDCALAMALAFWDDPALAPDATCIQSIGNLNFVR